MDKATARELLKFVNDPWILEDLKIYMNARLLFLRKQLELANSMDEVRKIQGAIEEIKRIEHLREEIRSRAE